MRFTKVILVTIGQTDLLDSMVKVRHLYVVFGGTIYPWK